MSFLLFLESLKCLLTNLYSSLLHSIQFYNQARKMMHYYSDRGGFWLATRRRRSSLLHKWCDKWHPTEIDEDPTEEEDDPGPKEDFTSQNMDLAINPPIKPIDNRQTGPKRIGSFFRYFWKGYLGNRENLGNNLNQVKIQLKMMH